MARQPVNLDRRITIQQSIETEDDEGGRSATWSNLVADLPAQYLPVGGAEKFSQDADRRRATANCRFRIRYRTDLTRKMRLTFDGDTWDVLHFEEEASHSRKQYMLIYAEMREAT